MQIKQLDVWCPVAFFSRRLDKTQQKYSAFDRELLAAYSAIKHFRHFLECRQFTLFTDHKPLVRAFQSTRSRELARRARYLSYIAEYTNDILHVVGSLNFAADALSRVQINNVEYFQNSLDYEKMALSQTIDAVIQDLLQINVTSLQLEQFALSRTSPSLIWCDVSIGAIRPVVPDSFLKDVFHKLHSLSHRGIKSTIWLITQRFVWPNMKKDIRAWVRECTVCQANKIHRHNFSEFKPYALPTARFQEINMDIVGPLPPSNGYKYLLTAIDRLTIFLTAVPMKDCTAQSVVDAFLHGYVAYFGVPKVIIPDRGAQFDSFLFYRFASIFGLSASSHYQ